MLVLVQGLPSGAQFASCIPTLIDASFLSQHYNPVFSFHPIDCNFSLLPSVDPIVGLLLVACISNFPNPLKIHPGTLLEYWASWGVQFVVVLLVSVLTLLAGKGKRTPG